MIRRPPRAALFSLFGVAGVLLGSACADDATGARTTLASVQNTSYVVQDPITTTTTTTTTAPATPPEGGQVSPTEQSYTVVSGDSVYKIANLHGIDPVDLANYNQWPEGIQHPLQVGNVVLIPPNAQVPGTGTATDPGAGTGTETTGDATTTQTSAAPGIACEHTVVAGDNQGRVANQYDVTLDELAAANANNPDWNFFPIGSIIHIPEGGSC